MLKVFKRHKALLLIIVLAALLRLVYLEYNPPSLNWDEVSHGYNAYSIVNTGKDEWGKSFPVIFRAYGDYKLPVYIYTTAVSIAALGLNAFAVRLPSALAGIGVVIFTYFTVIELFNKVKITNLNKQGTALLAALLVAIEPWSLFLSRAALEANLALFLFICATYLFLKALSHFGPYLFVSTFLFGLTMWTYNSYRIFTPLMLTGAAVVYRKELSAMFKKTPKKLIISTAIWLLFFIPMLYQLAKPTGQARYEWVALIDKGAIAQINEKRAASNLTPMVEKVLYNKVTYFVPRFTKNWFSHFSADFLFFQGGDHFQFSIPGRGLLYIVNIPFLIFGFFYLFKMRNKTSHAIFIWIASAPVASSLTREAPHALRAITLLPIPMLLSALGVVLAAEYISKKISGNLFRNTFVLVYLLILVWGLSAYLINYFGRYRENYSWAWQYGYEKMVQEVKDKYEDYNKIIITKKYGEPHEFVLFYWPWPPGDYINDEKLVRFHQSNWYWVDAFDKFYFVNDWQIDEKQLGNYTFSLESGSSVHCTPKMFDCLLVTSPGNSPPGWEKLETIDFLEGKSAFEIYEN